MKGQRTVVTSTTVLVHSLASLLYVVVEGASMAMFCVTQEWRHHAMQNTTKGEYKAVHFIFYYKIVRIDAI